MTWYAFPISYIYKKRKFNTNIKVAHMGITSKFKDNIETFKEDLASGKMGK